MLRSCKARRQRARAPAGVSTRRGARRVPLESALSSIEQPAPSDNSPPQSDSVAAGLGRKVLIAGMLAALVWAALALYGDVNELRRTARRFAPLALAGGLGLVAGNYALRIARWHYYLRHIGVAVPAVESALV